MGLREEIESKRMQINTENYSMSIGEWINLYKDNELDIHPEFQRFFRWSDSQKTLFIESILLGIPVPPIFVAQRNDGVWDVIDGLQRLSTIFQFLGILKDEEDILVPPLVLEKTKYLPSLVGKTWGENDENGNVLDADQRLLIKRAKLTVNIVLRESDENVRFELFQRLNMGGSALSNQEMRNCILVQINRDFYRWIDELSRYDNFKECTALTDRALAERYDLELILRFLVFRTLPEPELRSIGDLGAFLTERMVALAKNANYNKGYEEEAFKTTFDILFRAVSEDSFKKYDHQRGDFRGGFIVTSFEVFGLGLGHHYPNVNFEDSAIREKVIEFWGNQPNGLQAGSGIRASTRIPTTIPIGRQIFAP